VVLLALLILLTLGGIGLMAAVDVWSVSRQRDLEKQLLFAGDQYRQAILRYYHAAPRGTPRVLPASLDELLADNRFPTPLHHLRRLYPDPMSGSAEWGELRIGGRLAGVYSTSERRPVKQAGFAPGYLKFEGKGSYRDWLFAIAPNGQPTFVHPDGAESGSDPLHPSDSTRPTARRTPS
jgi:type II secretory pathway pseudopilin PulG